jgi:methionyl-tRNA formyltransferase
MKKISEKVVFFGSGPVAAKSLELLAQDFDIEAVVTKPKPAHHKGAFPVIDIAEKLKLPTFTVEDKKSLGELVATKPFKSPLGILIDFGIIVSQDVIDYFPRGIINSHFSVLPEWRGADPITFAVLSGQKSTGVSLMLLVEAMDEGPLIAYGEYALPPGITTPELTKHLIHFSHELLKREVPRYMAGARPSTQDVTNRKASYSRKLTKADGIIDWKKPADQIEREVRAFLGWPGSRTTLAGKDVLITQAHVVSTKGKPGSTAVINKELIVYCAEDALVIDKLKPAGKSEMDAQAFVAGHKDALT